MTSACCERMKSTTQEIGRFFDICFGDLASFSQSPVYPSRNAFRDAEGFVGPFHAAFARSPLNHTGLSDKHSTDCSIAQIPQVGELSYRIMLLENRCQVLPRAEIECWLKAACCLHTS